MNVIAFPQRAANGSDVWRSTELAPMLGSLAPFLRTGAVSGWHRGATERGDPQLYVLGPPPNHDCILCVSRLGSRYLLEDGLGRLLSEHNSLMGLAEQIKSVLRTGKAGVIARLTLIWCAFRQTVEEKIEPMMGEGEEFLTHIAPQLAALA
jgi:hypothetical protein